MEKKKILIWAFIIIVLALVCLEIYLRVNSDITRIKGQGMFIADDKLGYTLKPNFSEYVDVKGGEVLISINDKGLRGSNQNYSRNSKTKRVLALGGSIPFGSDIEYDEMYLTKMQKQFSAEGKNVEIINGALPGYQFSQDLGYYKKELYKYKPDVVLLSLVLDDVNDINTTALSEMVRKYDNIQVNEGKFEELVKKSCYSCVFFYGLYLNQKERHIQSVFNLWNDGKTYNLFEERLTDLKNNLSASKIPLIIIVFPYNQQFSNAENYSKEPQVMLASLSEDLNVTYIDLLPYLDKPSFEDYYLVNDKIHLSNKGFEQIEEAVFEAVNEKLKL